MKHESQINVFHTFFRGREDVFAVRWEKSGKSGYMPAYRFDLHHYRVHKMNGGTFSNYPHKTYLPLTNNEIEKHLNGVQQIGVYPLLQDNTSWFLVADFDKQNWKEEAVTFLNACKEKNIPAYLERSRSGNGGHVWVFFDKPYPAIRSRNVFISILEQSGAFSMFDKNSSFDRLFPNQDFLSGKGLGNLIALPFFKPAMDNGNSCFINPETFEPYANQWHFLKEMVRVSIDVLDNLFEGNSITQDLPINYVASCGSPENHNFYTDAENVLEDILKGQQYKHSKHIQFLAERHERNVMKLRFVLQPFSFVFLISGEENYHIILETLDTEEATYIWHTDKSKTVLIDKIKQIDKELNFIRQKGRQPYLETNPQNFSRIVHDYSEGSKGFTIWKGQLEERLV